LLFYYALSGLYDADIFLLKTQHSSFNTISMDVFHCCFITPFQGFTMLIFFY
jgi:hypothetical protein